MKIKEININKHINPWGNDEKVKQETLKAIENRGPNPKAFNCKKCGISFQPEPYQWIFYDLCADCFKQFDTQKMMGRRATLSKKGRHVKHFEDVDKWIKHVVN